LQKRIILQKLKLFAKPSCELKFFVKTFAKAKFFVKQNFAKAREYSLFAKMTKRAFCFSAQ
jgi:hypothetical protein